MVTAIVFAGSFITPATPESEYEVITGGIRSENNTQEYR